MRNRFVQISLAMIVVLLAVIAFQQGPAVVDGAAAKEYKVIYYTPPQPQSPTKYAASTQAILNQQANEGWELVQAPSDAVTGYYIFKK